MKKFIALLIMVLLLCGLCTITAFAEDNISSTLEDGVLTISGSGRIQGSQFIRRDDFHTVIIEEGITRIEEYAFSYCHNLKTVSLPNTLERIEEHAFTYCDNLEEIEIPSSVSYIGDGVFWGSENITVTLHYNEKSKIDDYAFVDVPKLIVVVPENWIGYYNPYSSDSVIYTTKAIKKTVSSWSELKNALEGLSYKNYIRVKCSENWKMQESEDFIEITANDCIIDFLDNHSIQSLSSNTGDYGVFFYINADNVTLNLNNKILRTGDSSTGDYVSAIVVNGNNCHILNGRFYDCGEPGPADDKEEVWGAAIWVTKYDSGCVIENCIFEKCKSAYGGAIYTGSSGTVIKNCIFNNNSARIQGNDICDWSEDAVVENCRTTHGDSSCFLYAKETKNCEYNQSFESIWNGNYSGFTLSQGNTWIIIAGAVVILGAIVVIAKKKKKVTE